MSLDLQSEKPTVSHLSYAELVGIYHHQMSRVETSWFRIMYLHAAIVGALIFFHDAAEFFLLPRSIVFVFYSANLLIFHFSLSEGYSGLRKVHEDLSRFPESGGSVDTWLRSRRYGHKTPVRVAIMLVAWAVIAYLLFSRAVWD